MWFSAPAVRGRSDCGVRGVARLGVTPPNLIADVIQLFRTDILLSIYIVVPLNQQLRGLQRTPLKPITLRRRFASLIFHGRAFKKSFHVRRRTLERPVESSGTPAEVPPNT
jgi:hypothetical protein